MKQFAVDGLDELKKKLEEIKNNAADTSHHPPTTFIFFVGSTLPETGQSWCPDCVKAHPAIEGALDMCCHLDAIFITCNVGFRDEWKDAKNPIKMDATFGVGCIPTLIQYSLEASRAIEGRKLEKDEHFSNASTIESFIRNN